MSASSRTGRPLLLLLAMLLPAAACSKERDPASQLLHDFVESSAANDRAAVTQMLAPVLKAKVLKTDSMWELFVGASSRCLGEGLKSGNTLRPVKSQIVDEQEFEKVMLITSRCSESTLEDGSNVVASSTVTVVRSNGQWLIAELSVLEGVPLLPGSKSLETR